MNSIWQRALRNSWLTPVILFLLCGMRNIDLPGLYMDAVNPDYLAARFLHPALHNPVYELPSYFFNILGNYYHGVQNYYVAVPFLAFFGSSVTSIRLAQMLFGAIIVAGCTSIVQRISRSNALALACGVALATEIAFIASFRDQNYIVLGGFAWLTLALLVLFPRNLPPEADRAISHRRIFVSGIFCGLAAYGYFVQIFFFPAMLLLTLRQGAFTGRTFMIWCAGVAVGLLPYAFGYFSMYLALGGIHPMMESLQAGLTTLQPMQAGGSVTRNLVEVFDFARFAVSDRENELMALGTALGSTWGTIKFGMLCFCSIALFAGLLANLARRRGAIIDLMMGMLPISFLCVSAVFGSRLGAHHFSVLVPLMYVLTALLVARVIVQPLRKRGSPTVARAAIVVLTVSAVIANFCQQQAYLNELNRTGGARRSSSALTTLADQARDTGQHSIYAFPDWGFFTSFAVLTENSVPYVLDISPAAIANARAANDGRNEIRLVYWDDKDQQRYTDALKAANVGSVEQADFRQRDGTAAFHMLRAHFIPVNTAKINGLK